MNVRSGECKPRTNKGHYTCDNRKKPVTVYLPDDTTPNTYGQLIFIKKAPEKNHPLVFMSKQYKVNNDSDMVVLGNDTKPLYVTAVFDGKGWMLHEITVNKNETLNNAIQKKKQVEINRNAYINKESDKYAQDIKNTSTNIGGIPKVDNVKSRGVSNNTKTYELVDNTDDNKDQKLHDTSSEKVVEKPRVKATKKIVKDQPVQPRIDGNDLLNRRPKHPNLIYERDKVIITNTEGDKLPPKMPPPESDFHVHVDDDEYENNDNCFTTRRKLNQKDYNSLYDGPHIPDSDSD